MTQGLISLVAFIGVAFSHYSTVISPVAGNFLAEISQKEQILASQSLDLTQRYKNDFVNEVFKDNILLALYYLRGEEKTREVDWEKVKQPVIISFILEPGEVFAFHDNVAKDFENRLVKSPKSKFSADEGYRNSGFLIGDGVCHLASLMNWVASEAGLEVIAKVNHNFAPVPGVPKEYGTSIRYSNTGHNSQNQNLYIINNFDYPVEFRFKVNQEKIDLEIVKKGA